MDRLGKAVDRLWGGVGDAGHLHAMPRFAQEMSNRCDDALALAAPGVSRWPLGRHLEHLYRASHYVLDRIEEAMSGANARQSMGPWGAALMTFGFIPRGMFPTIPQLEPKDGTMEAIDPLRATLRDRLAAIPWDLAQIRRSPGKSRHPRMKWLTASQWLFFADVHHRHHLRIIRDIVRSK